MINVDKGEEEEEYMHSSFREGFSQAERKPKDAWMEGSFGAGGLNSKLSRNPTLQGNEACISKIRDCDAMSEEKQSIHCDACEKGGTA